MGSGASKKKEQQTKEEQKINTTATKLKAVKGFAEGSQNASKHGSSAKGPKQSLSK